MHGTNGGAGKKPKMGVWVVGYDNARQVVARQV
jgi:hypothetical protein